MKQASEGKAAMSPAQRPGLRYAAVYGDPARQDLAQAARQHLQEAPRRNYGAASAAGGGGAAAAAIVGWLRFGLLGAIVFGALVGGLTAGFTAAAQQRRRRRWEAIQQQHQFNMMHGQQSASQDAAVDDLASAVESERRFRGPVRR